MGGALDAASVRPPERLQPSTIEKLVGFFIGFATYFGIGFAIWNWQYNEAFEVPNPLGQSIEDFWSAWHADQRPGPDRCPPTVFTPASTNFQIFIFFLAVFAGIVPNILLHSRFGADEGLGLLHHLLRGHDRLVPG